MEVGFNRLDAQEERAGDLAIGGTACDLERDLQLLCGQCAERRLARRRWMLARELKLVASPPCEPARAKPLEDRHRVPEVLARGSAPPGAPQALSPAELAARELERQWRRALELDRLCEGAVEVIRGQQALAARGGRERPGAPGRLRLT